MLLCTGAFAQYDATVRSAKSVKGAETAVAEMPEIAPSMRVKGQSVNNKLVEDNGATLVNVAGASKQMKVAPKGTVTTDQIYGDVIYPSPVGSAKINVNGNYEIFATLAASQYHTAMGIKDNIMMGFVWTRTSSGITTAEFKTYNLDTKAETTVDLAANFADQYLQCGAYNPADNCFYGYTYNGWVKYDVDAKTFSTPIPRDDSALYRMTFNTNTNKMVGVNLSNGEFKEFNLENGAQTLKTTITELICPYIVGLGYDYKSNNYLYNVNTDAESTLVAIDPSTYAVTKLCDVAQEAEIACIYVNEVKPADPEAPQAAEFVTSDFTAPSLTGSVTFKMPSKKCDENGTAITGAVNYTLSINGTEYKSGSATAGDNVKFDITSGTVNGNNEFSIVCSLGTHVSKACSQVIYLGYDIPSAPKNVVLTATTVSWDAVTTGVSNGFVDADKMTYTVEVNGKVVAKNLKETTCPSYLPANAELTEYVATVYATSNGLTSAGGNSAGIMFGEAYKEPVFIAPSAKEAPLFTIIDNNADKKTWAYYTGTSSAPLSCFRYSYHSSNAADDYLMLPPVQIMDMSVMHEFNFEAWAQSASYPEAVEVYIGTQPTVAAMTQQILPKTAVTGLNASRQNLTAYFSVPKAGTYYIGIKAASDKNEYYLMVDNFNVDASSVKKIGPAAVVDPTITAGAQGALNATVEFTMPTTTVEGSPLTDNVTVQLTSLIDQKTVVGAPGAKMSVEMAGIQGDNEVEIVPSIGENGGMPTILNVWCGIDIPVGVDNLKCVMAESNYAGTLTWDAPTNSVHGGYLPASGFTYTLYQYQVTGEIFGIPIGSWQPIGTIGKDVKEYTFDVSASAPMPLTDLQLAIGATSAGGQGTTISTVTPQIGDPYELPAYETYVSSSSFNYSPVKYISDLDGNGTKCTLSIAKPTGVYAEPDGNYALKMTGAAGEESCIILPKFSTKGMTKVAFIPTLYSGSCDNVIITVESSEGEQQVFNLAALLGMPTDQYIEPVIELPAQFQDKGWIQVRLYPTFVTGKTNFYMTHYALKNMVPEDIRMAVAGSEKAYVGEAAKFEAQAKSIGTGSARLTGVKFTAKNAAGDVLFENTVPQDTIIETGESVIVSTEFTPVFDNVGSYTLTAELLDADDVNVNNTATMNFEIAKGKAILVDDLAGEISDEVINLTWTAPAISAGFESFEDDTPFVVNDGHIGAFTQKNDGKSAYTWQNAPDVVANTKGQPGFQVYSDSQLTAGGFSSFNVPDGDQFAMIFCPDDGSAADSWLISPSVKGGSAASFKTRALTEQYGMEVIEVCYSTVDSDDVENFVVLDNVEVGETWQDVEFTLPADAKRFAIHYISKDIFGLLVDAITYAPAAGLLEVSGYDIYRASGATAADCTNFAKIATSSTPAYTDATADLTKYNVYYVIPKLSDGSFGLEGNKAQVDPKSTEGVDDINMTQGIYGGQGFVAVVGYEGETVVVAAADGKVYFNAVAENNEKVAVPAGIYVVKAGKKVAKVVVK